MWVNPLSRFSLLTLVPQSSDWICGMAPLRAANAVSTRLICSVVASFLNLKETTCLTLSSARIAVVLMRRDARMARSFMWFIG